MKEASMPERLRALALYANALTRALRQVPDLDADDEATRRLRLALDRLLAEGERLLGVPSDSPDRRRK